MLNMMIRFDPKSFIGIILIVCSYLIIANC